MLWIGLAAKPKPKNDGKCVVTVDMIKMKMVQMETNRKPLLQFCAAFPSSSPFTSRYSNTNITKQVFEAHLTSKKLEFRVVFQRFFPTFPGLQCFIGQFEAVLEFPQLEGLGGCPNPREFPRVALDPGWGKTVQLKRVRTVDAKTPAAHH